MAKAKLVLDAEHRYWLDGVTQELTGCTTALKGVGLIQAQHYTQEGLDRGNYVHDQVERTLLEDGRGLDIEDERGGYVDAAVRFINENKVDVLHVEQPFADPTRMMAGKPDVIALWTPPDGGERFVIVDWKTGGPERWHRYQSAWYEHLARENKRVEGLCDRVMVHLKADGSYIMRRYTDRTDWKVADAVRLVDQAKKAA